MSKQLKDLVHQLIPQEFQWKIGLLQNWKTIIGPLHDKVAIHAIQERSLILEVSHPAWAQELLHLTPLIKQRINSALNNTHIQEIRFKVTMPRAFHPKKNNYRQAFISLLKKKPQTSYTLSNREECALTSLKNEELKDAMRAFLVACKQS